MEKVKILLIEDHVMTRLGTAMVIKQVENFELVAEAGDGESGVSLARKFLPDVILMDIGLPKLDGIEATKKLKQELAEENLAQTIVLNDADLDPVISMKTEVQAVDEIDIEVTDKEEEKPKKTARSKRPNRNTQKKPRVTKKSVKKDED